MPVDFNLPAGPQVHDHIPVQPALIVVARFRISRPQREVHRPTDLFIEERVLRLARDVVIRPDCALAQKSAAGVHIQHRE